MSKITIYDKAMCCPTGLCGVQVDPKLTQFAADLDWLKSQGHDVQRWNLAQDPAHFATHTTVQHLLETQGVDCLPIIFIDDSVRSQGDYPSRHTLAEWTHSKLATPSTLPLIIGQSSCQGSSGCC